MREGGAQQYRAGLRAFLLPGIDLSINYEYDINDEQENDKDKTSETSAISSQLHVML